MEKDFRFFVLNLALNKPSKKTTGCIRVLSQHPKGLVATAIARLLDEYAFQQAPRTVSNKMKKLVSRGVVIKEKTLYRLNHPKACGQVWLSCL